MKNCCKALFNYKNKYVQVLLGKSGPYKEKCKAQPEKVYQIIFVATIYTR